MKGNVKSGLKDLFYLNAKLYKSLKDPGVPIASDVWFSFQFCKLENK